LGGKRREADSLASWIISEGEYGSPSFDYFLFKAAKRLNCSAIELEAHPDCAALMHRALTVEYGEEVGLAGLKKKREGSAPRTR
jgi:hypothetical protein